MYGVFLSAVFVLGQPLAPPPDDPAVPPNAEASVEGGGEVEAIPKQESIGCDSKRCSPRVFHRGLNRIAKGSTWQEVHVCGPNGCTKIRVMAPEQPTMFKGKRSRYRGIVAGSCDISIKWIKRSCRKGFWRVRYRLHKG